MTGSSNDRDTIGTGQCSRLYSGPEEGVRVSSVEG